MAKKSPQPVERNWALVIMASLVIVLSVVLLVVALIHMKSLGWWSLAIAAGAVSSLFLSVMAIRRNDPSWLLLDLILPG